MYHPQWYRNVSTACLKSKQALLIETILYRAPLGKPFETSHSLLMLMHSIIRVLGWRVNQRALRAPPDLLPLFVL